MAGGLSAWTAAAASWIEHASRCRSLFDGCLQVCRHLHQLFLKTHRSRFLTARTVLLPCRACRCGAAALTARSASPRCNGCAMRTAARRTPANACAASSRACMAASHAEVAPYCRWVRKQEAGYKVQKQSAHLKTHEARICGGRSARGLSGAWLLLPHFVAGDVESPQSCS